MPPPKVNCSSCKYIEKYAKNKKANKGGGISTEFISLFRLKIQKMYQSIQEVFNILKRIRMTAPSFYTSEIRWKISKHYILSLTKKTTSELRRNSSEIFELLRLVTRLVTKTKEHR